MRLFIIGDWVLVGEPLPIFFVKFSYQLFLHAVFKLCDIQRTRKSKKIK